MPPAEKSAPHFHQCNAPGPEAASKTRSTSCGKIEETVAIFGITTITRILPHVSRFISCHAPSSAAISLRHLRLFVAGVGPQGGDMSREAPEQEVEAQPGDQQGAAPAGGRREPLQGHDESQAQGDRGLGTELCQLELAAAEGATGRAEFVGGVVPE